MNILCTFHMKQPELVYAMTKVNKTLEKEKLDYLCYMLSYLMAMAFNAQVLHSKKEDAETLYKQVVNSYKFMNKLFE